MLEQFATTLEMGFFHFLIEAIAKVFYHQKVIAKAKIYRNPVLIFRLTTEHVEFQFLKDRNNVFDMFSGNEIITPKVILIRTTNYPIL